MVKNINVEKIFNHFIDEYSNLVFSICYKITKHYFDAEDLTQETFLSVYKNISSFDGQNEKAWISKIATNKCLDYIKSAKRRVIPKENTYFYDIESHLSNPETLILEDEVKQQLYSACMNLKPPYQKIALCYFYEGKSLSEIAKTENKNLKTLQTQIYRSKAMLRKIMQEEKQKSD